MCKSYRESANIFYESKHMMRSIQHSNRVTCLHISGYCCKIVEACPTFIDFSSFYTETQRLDYLHCFLYDFY